VTPQPEHACALEFDLLTTFLMKNGIAENDVSVGERCAPAGVPVLAGYLFPGKSIFLFFFPIFGEPHKLSISILQNWFPQ
jgi:hypothetical protein